MLFRCSYFFTGNVNTSPYCIRIKDAIFAVKFEITTQLRTCIPEKHLKQADNHTGKDAGTRERSQDPLDNHTGKDAGTRERSQDPLDNHTGKDAGTRERSQDPLDNHTGKDAGTRERSQDPLDNHTGKDAGTRERSQDPFIFSKKDTTVFLTFMLTENFHTFST